MTTDWDSDPDNPANENRYPFQRKVTAVNTVKDRIDYLTSVGVESLKNTNDFIAELQELLAALEPPDVSDIDYNPPSWTPPNYDGRPELGILNETVDWPGEIGDLTLDDIDPIAGVTFPDFDIGDPNFKDHEVTGWKDVGDAPEPEEPTYPDDVEDFTGNPPHAITTTDPVIPPPPPTNLQPFDKTLISWTGNDPEKFTWGDDEKNYDSDIWGTLLEKVLYNISNGGTGLDAQVEEDIYWQHLNRTFEENDKLIQQASNYWSARGFTLPPGMLSAKINEINTQISRNNLQASKDITISQAELAQKNTHFFIDKGAQLEGMLREFFIQQVNASLQAQRSIAENAIAVFDANVKKHNYYLEEFRGWIAKYEQDVRYELGKVEMYRAEMEGAKVHADVEKTKADVYTAEINGYRARVDAYTSKIQANAAKVEIERLKMQIFSEEIKAFLGKIELNKARIMEFEAKIRGEAAKAEGYRARVEAFVAETEAKKAELQGQVAEQQAELQVNQGYIAEYTAKADGYRAKVQGAAAEIGFKVDGYKALVSAYQAETQRADAENRTQIAELEAEIKRAELEIQKGVAQVNAAIQGYLGVKNLQVEGTSGIMNVGAQLAASAMNAINTSAGISYSGSDGLSDTYSTSDSLSEIHSYVYNQD